VELQANKDLKRRYMDNGGCDRVNNAPKVRYLLAQGSNFRLLAINHGSGVCRHGYSYFMFNCRILSFHFVSFHHSREAREYTKDNEIQVQQNDRIIELLKEMSRSKHNL
jgi:hypothetical protein